jgi:hypothetical protein
MSNITRFPNFNLSDVPACLRKLADDVESGERPARQVVVCILNEDGKTDYAAFGPDFFWIVAVGLLEAIKVRIRSNFDGV